MNRRVEIMRNGLAMEGIFRCGEWLEMTLARDISFGDEKW